MNQIIIDSLNEMGDLSKISQIQSVHGGDINETFYAKTRQGEYFIKLHFNAPLNFFKVEADGLKILRDSKTIAIPEVFFLKETKEYSILIMEWVNGQKNAKTTELLGQGVGMLHQVKGRAFGREEASFIGKVFQENGWYDSWITYYRDKRLLPHIEYASQQGVLDKKTRRKLETLLENLERWLPVQCHPSLLHGDLWGGNWIVGQNGIPYLIDPSVLYGHNEFEIAFTELFGGFPQEFYDAYQEVFPLSSDYQDRKPLYQLYYLLIHLILFGEIYLDSINRVVNYYVG